MLILYPSIVNATSGCCSHHGGVDCSKKQVNGRVICNDGWIGSSCLYSSMAKCKGYSSNSNETASNNNINSDTNEAYNVLWYILVGTAFVYFCYKGFNNKVNNISQSDARKSNSDFIKNRNKIINNSSDYISEKYKMLENAINNNIKLTIKYISQKNEITIRQIIPKEIYKENNNYYLKAFCLLRNEERVFKISRIIEVKIDE